GFGGVFKGVGLAGILAKKGYKSLHGDHANASGEHLASQQDELAKLMAEFERLSRMEQAEAPRAAFEQAKIDKALRAAGKVERDSSNAPFFLSGENVVLTSGMKIGDPVFVGDLSVPNANLVGMLQSRRGKAALIVQMKDQPPHMVPEVSVKTDKLSQVPKQVTAEGTFFVIGGKIYEQASVQGENTLLKPRADYRVLSWNQVISQSRRNEILAHANDNDPFARRAEAHPPGDVTLVSDANTTYKDWVMAGNDNFSTTKVKLKDGKEVSVEFLGINPDEPEVRMFIQVLQARLESLGPSERQWLETPEFKITVAETLHNYQRHNNISPSHLSDAEAFGWGPGATFENVAALHNDGHAVFLMNFKDKDGKLVSLSNLSPEKMRSNFESLVDHEIIGHAQDWAMKRVSDSPEFYQLASNTKALEAIAKHLGVSIESLRREHPQVSAMESNKARPQEVHSLRLAYNPNLRSALREITADLLANPKLASNNPELQALSNYLHTRARLFNTPEPMQGNVAAQIAHLESVERDVMLLNALHAEDGIRRQTLVLKAFEKELKDTGLEAAGWKIFPTQEGSPADKAGADFLMVHQNGAVHFLDLKTESQANAARFIPGIRQAGVIEVRSSDFDNLNFFPRKEFLRINGQHQLVALAKSEAPFNFNSMAIPSALNKGVEHAIAQNTAFVTSLSRSKSPSTEHLIYADYL
ncbi:MAG: hypothetical protein K2X81_00950, partial [Candidatus Obscuribacterales bacterium]|nr:hypothetical protein [Candidatus Obscuribacterales bacterium]